VVVDPASDYVKVAVRARTSRRPGGNLLVRSESEGEQSLVTVSGRIAIGSEPRVFFRRIEHPSLVLGATLRELCLRRGIKIDQRTVRRGTIAPTQRVLAQHVSEPLSILIRTVNKRSNNMMSEQILKTIGAEAGGQPGTFTKGLASVQKFLTGIGMAPGYRYGNGSGLYDTNRFSPQHMVSLLRYAYRDFRIQSDFVASLAVAGADGTVSHRLSGRPSERYVRAKTGTLAGVSTLSGFAGADAHGPVAFSILMNQIPDGSEAVARRAQDEIADALVLFLQNDR
jgi:D-alanyl-D-alanine carboxypeptidase/D-alanyl-D-alanine-endopeptidase (penicillin-binding protein 4)